MKNYITLLSFILVSPFLGFSQYFEVNPTNYFSGTELAAANTASNEDYLTEEEKNIFLYTNLARMFPRKFSNFYRAYAIEEGSERKLKSNFYYSSLTKTLRTMQPVDALLPSKEMFDLAECWAIESGEKGLVGHDRVKCPSGYSGENCGYGYQATGQYFVMLLLIDEGVRGVGHRKNILYPDFKGMGVAIRPHRDYKYDAVQNFSYTNDAIDLQRKIEEREEGKRQAERDTKIQARQLEFQRQMDNWNPQEISQADQARSLSYLTDLEKDLYFYTNLLKLNPKKFKEVVWDEGPFFDQLPFDLEQGIRKDLNYKRVSNWLSKANSRNITPPDRESIEVLRCVAERYLAGKNHKSCFEFPGSWRLQSYYSESSFNDIMNMLLNPDDFNDIINNATVVVHEGDPNIKLFMSRN